MGRGGATGGEVPLTTPTTARSTGAERLLIAAAILSLLPTIPGCGPRTEPTGPGAAATETYPKAVVLLVTVVSLLAGFHSPSSRGPARFHSAPFAWVAIAGNLPVIGFGLATGARTDWAGWGPYHWWASVHFTIGLVALIAGRGGRRRRH